MKFERVEVGSGLTRQADRLLVRPSTLAELFGPPSVPDGRYATGTYRFRGEDGAPVELFDWRLAREATGSREDRPAAQLWSSPEGWTLEVACQDPKVLPSFYQWLGERMEGLLQARLEPQILAAEKALESGKLKEATEKFRQCAAVLPTDTRLQGVVSARVRKGAARAALPPESVLEFRYGLANAPDSRGGEDRLRMFPDGRLELEVLQRQQRRSWTARTEPEVVARYREVLLEVGFPDIPLGEMVPGPSFWTVIAEGPGSRATATFTTLPYRDRVPHHQLFDVGTGLCARIRQEGQMGIADRVGLKVWDIVAKG